MFISTSIIIWKTTIHMKYTALFIFIIVIILDTSGQNYNKTENEQSLISKLEIVENSEDIKLIQSIFTENAVLYTPDLPPIRGKEGVVSIYEFIFSRHNVEYVKYITDTIYEKQNKHFEGGVSINKKIEGAPDTNEFKAVFIRQGDEYKISEISFGKEEDLKREIPELIKPTGKYQVGQATYFYDKTNSDNSRLLSFQIWYPTITKSNSKVIYKSKEVVKASADFVGFPLFIVSYFSFIESNSYSNTPAYPSNKFPVLLYNHGYGGFTSVYQTVFEELASNGYIVVSIAHENESSLFIKEDGKVIANSPENEFYKSRSSELTGRKIEEFQSIILNSDELKDNQEAYQELIKLSPLHNESTRLWQSDTKAVLMKLEELNKTDTNLADAFDFESVGVFGHSLGGATAGQLGFDSKVIKAGINLDGFQFGDLVNNKLTIPFMFVSSNQEGDRYLRATTFMDRSEADCYEVAIKGFTHGSFTDLESYNKIRSKPSLNHPIIT